MPKKTRITVATTTATSPIIAPKRGPSPSMLAESSQVNAYRGVGGGTDAVFGDWGRTVRDPIDLLCSPSELQAGPGRCRALRREHRHDEVDDVVIVRLELSTSNEDAAGDLIEDSLGAATGGLLLVAWTKYGWGSVRRVASTNRAEDVDG